jgi:diaminopimelate epimerase
MHIPFSKMQGCGNDFVVADNRVIGKPLAWWIEQTPLLCNRRTGIGADGLLLLDHSETADFTMIYRNADGSDAGMCGNGGRCIAAFAHRAGFAASHSFDVHGRIYKATVSAHSDSDALVDLVFPVIVKPEMRSAGVEHYAFAFTGTEHLVVPATENRLNQPDWLRKRGSILRHNLQLSHKGANVNFFIRKDGRLHLQTFERGVEDLTLACGTGALATAVVDHFLTGATDSRQAEPVQCAGGTLFVSYTYHPNNRYYTDLVLSGAATFVFDGTILLS